MNGPLAVAFVNVVFPGVGYLFIKNRKKKIFGFLFAISVILGFVWAIVEPTNPLASAFFISETTPGLALEIITMLLIMAAFGYDGYNEARKEQLVADR